MSSSGVDPSRQVPDGLDDTERIFGYSQSEVTTIIVCFFGGILSTNLVPQSYSIYMLITSIVFGFLVIFLTPNHLEPTEWIGSVSHYFSRPSKVPHVSLSDGMAREQKDVVTEAEVYELNERTQEVTWVNRIHRDAGAVERIDGAMVGAIKIDPANMALAAESDWEKMISNWQSYLDNTVEYPVQIYATSTPFEVEDYVEHYQRRMNDPDLQERPIMLELLRDFLDWYPQYLQYQGTHKKEYYLIFSVEKSDVYGSDLQEQGIVEQLSELPVIGDTVNTVFGDEGSRDEAEVRAEQISELESRISEGINQGIRPLPGCDAQRISGFELALLIKEYWEGRDMQLEDEDALTQVGISRRADEAVDPQDYPLDGGYRGTSE